MEKIKILMICLGILLTGFAHVFNEGTEKTGKES